MEELSMDQRPKSKLAKLTPPPPSALHKDYLGFPPGRIRVKAKICRDILDFFARM